MCEGGKFCKGVAASGDSHVMQYTESDLWHVKRGKVMAATQAHGHQCVNLVHIVIVLHELVP